MLATQAPSAQPAVPGVTPFGWGGACGGTSVPARKAGGLPGSGTRRSCLLVGLAGQTRQSNSRAAVGETEKSWGGSLGGDSGVVFLDLAYVKRFLAGCVIVSPGLGGIGAPLPAATVPVPRCGESVVLSLCSLAAPRPVPLP